jgi:hypothetical protein
MPVSNSEVRSLSLAEIFVEQNAGGMLAMSSGDAPSFHYAEESAT